MPVYTYRCIDPACGAKVEAYRTFDKSGECPVCPLCVAPTHKLISRSQVVARPWYDKPGVADEIWSSLDQGTKTETRKKWDAENDASWDGKAPSKEIQETTSAVDIFHGLDSNTVQRELASMNAE